MVLEWIRWVHMIQCGPLKVADRSKTSNFVLWYISPSLDCNRAFLITILLCGRNHPLLFSLMSCSVKFLCFQYLCCYAFCFLLDNLITNQEISTLAVSLSTNALKFYSPATGQYLGKCKGHEGTIHEISFSVPSSPQVICSCSSDGTVRAWDTRNFKQVFPTST